MYLFREYIVKKQKRSAMENQNNKVHKNRYDFSPGRILAGIIGATILLLLSIFFG